jgi:hypothetical protein
MLFISGYVEFEVAERKRCKCIIVAFLRVEMDKPIGSCWSI